MPYATRREYQNYALAVQTLLLGNNGLTHSSDLLSGDEVVFKILTNVKRSLDTDKVNVPLTDSVNADVTVVEHSAPEGAINVARENLGEHASFLSLIEHALLLDNEAVVELNVLVLKLNNVNDDHNKRNDKPEGKNSPNLECGKNTLSCYDMGSVYSHMCLLLSACAP